MGRWEELHRRNSLSNFENRNGPLDVVQENGWGHRIGAEMTGKQLLNELIEKVKSDHSFTAQDSNWMATALAFEQKYGFKLPEDLKEFYSHINSADLFEDGFVIVPIQDIVPATASIYGENCNSVELFLPDSWFAFATHGGSGDWIVIDLNPSEGGIYPILDLWHEDPDNCEVIALSFTEFLSDVLAFGGGEGTLYWLHGDKEPYGKAHIEEAQPSSEQLRNASDSIIQNWEPEIGPEKCKSEGCEKFHMPLSVLCRRHHLEMVNHRFRISSEEYEAKPARVIYEKYMTWT